MSNLASKGGVEGEEGAEGLCLGVCVFIREDLRDARVLY